MLIRNIELLMGWESLKNLSEASCLALGVGWNRVIQDHSHTGEHPRLLWVSGPLHRYCL